MSGNLAAVAAYDAPPDQAGGTLARLAASSAHLESLLEAVAAEKSRRDELIRLARDEGAHWSKIAKASRRGISRCVAIVAGELASVFRDRMRRDAA